MSAFRRRVAWRRHRLYVKWEKFLALFSSAGRVERILFSGKPDWSKYINEGFRRLPHQVEFGPITEESFQRYDIVVPLSLPTLEEARRYPTVKKKALPLPTTESVSLCDDKYKFNQALIKAGFGQHIPRMGEGMELMPPYVLKKRIGEGGIGCYIIRNHDDEEAQLGRITDPKYFCQEFIPGPVEFATHVLFIGDRIVKAVNIKYEFGSDIPIKGQNSDLLLQVVHRCPYLKLFARILQAIQFEGLCCVNYKVAKGQPFLLEINPRFGGSLAPYFFSFVRHLR
jgi:predicted ATP-grasp superfamily ATP-dependent carboligase